MLAILLLLLACASFVRLACSSMAALATRAPGRGESSSSVLCTTSARRPVEAANRQLCVRRSRGLKAPAVATGDRRTDGIRAGRKPRHVTDVRKAGANGPWAEPRDHQVQAIQRTLQHFQKHARGQLVLPGGSGKTLTAMWIVEEMFQRFTRPPQEFLAFVFVPLQALVRQTWQTYLDHSSIEWDAMLVCSDRFRLPGALQSTNETAIRSFLSRLRRRTGLPKIVVATYHSAHRVILQAMTQGDHQAEIVVFDEAHRLAGPTAQKWTRHFLDDTRLRARRRLSMTATPRIWKVSANQRPIASMDNETMFGQRIYQLSYSASVSQKVTSPIKMLIINATQSDYIQRAGAIRKNLTLPWGDDIPVRHVELVLALEEAAQTFGVRRVIVFHNRVAAARNFVKNAHRISDALGLPQILTHFCVDSRMPLANRERVLAEAWRVPSVVSNCYILTTGVNVPTVDAVVFMERRASHVGILQSIARAARVAPGKRLGYVIVPLYSSDVPDNAVPSDEEDDQEQAFVTADDALSEAASVAGRERQAHYRQIVDLIQAFASQDSTFAEALRRHSTNVGMQSLPDQAQDSTHTDDAAQEIMDRIEMPATVSLGCVQRAISVAAVELATWERFYGMLSAYKKAHGHCRVLGSYRTADGFGLGHWVAVQRNDFHNDRLGHDRRDKLNAIGFDWERPAVRKARLWEENFERLVDYKAKHGDTLVPFGYVTDDDARLGEWVARQRQRFHKGSLAKDRETLLNSTDFVFDIDLARQAAREGLEIQRSQPLLKRLKEFRQQFGHCSPPQSYKTADGYGLGSNMVYYRCMQRQGQISKYLERQLQSLGVKWDRIGAARRSWDDHFDQFVEFKAANGDCAVPKNMTSLYRWLTWSRKQLRDNCLADDKAERLRQVLGENGELKVVNENWDEGFDRLQAWHAKHGHSEVPLTYTEPDGYLLGKWLKLQRELQCKGELLQNRFEKLQELGVCWSITEKKWRIGYQAYKDFAYRQSRLGGVFKIPRNETMPDGRKLEAWCRSQRQRLERGKMTVAHKNLLDKVRFDWNPPAGRQKKLRVNATKKGSAPKKDQPSMQ